MYEYSYSTIVPIYQCIYVSFSLLICIPSKNENDSSEIWRDLSLPTPETDLLCGMVGGVFKSQRK